MSAKFETHEDSFNTIWLDITAPSGLRCSVPATRLGEASGRETIAARVFKELAAAPAAPDADDAKRAPDDFAVHPHDRAAQAV